MAMTLSHHPCDLVPHPLSAAGGFAGHSMTLRRLLTTLVFATLASSCGAPPLGVTAATSTSTPTVGDTVALVARPTPADEKLAVAWVVKSAPEGSTAAIEGADRASATFVPDVKGEYLMTATVTDPKAEPGDRAPASATVGLQVLPRPAAAIAFARQPGGIVAGVPFNPTVLVQVRDAAGGVAAESSALVSLALRAPAGSSAKLLGSVSVAAASGEARFPDLSVDLAGTGYLLAASTGGLETVESAPFDVAAAAPDAEKSSFTADQPSTIAGTGRVALRVVVDDRFGNPISGVSVSLSAPGDGMTLEPATGTTDAAGAFASVFSGSVAGTATLTARVEALSLVTHVVVVPGAPDPSRSAVEVLPTTIAADGVEAAAVSLVVHDAFQNPVPGAHVAFSGEDPADMFSPAAAGDTDGQGTFTAAVSSTKAGSRHVVASIGGGTLRAPITFLAGAPASAHTTMSVSPATLVADDVASASVSVRVGDALDNTVPGADVLLTVQGAGCTVAPADGTVTGADGTAAFSVTSRAAGTRGIVAHLAGFEVTGSLLFTPGPAEAARSTLAALPAQLVADGTAASALDVVLRDRFDNPVPGVEVTFAVGGAGNRVQPSAPQTTDASGHVAAALSSTVAEAKQVTARFGTQSLAAEVRFVPGAPVATTSTIAAGPDRVVADGTAVSTVSVVVRDAQRNPVSGVAVGFTADGTDNTLADAASATDARGEASVRISSTKAEMKNVKVLFGNGQSLTVRVLFVAGTPALAHSAIAAAPDHVAADGEEASTVVATLRDANDNPCTGVLVRFSAGGTGAWVSPAVVTTGTDGAATTRASAIRAGAVPVTATFAGQQHLDASVTFVAGPPVTATSTLTATPDTLVADGTTTTLLALTLADRNGNAVAGASVTFSATPDAGSVWSSATTVTTSSTGTASVRLASTKAGEKVVEASFGEAQAVGVPVVFTAGPPASAKSSLAAEPGSIVADGVAVLNLTATVRDARDNPVPWTQVAFSSTGTANTFSATTAETGADGTATVSLRSTKAEVKTVTAAVAGGPSLQTTATFYGVSRRLDRPSA